MSDPRPFNPSDDFWLAASLGLISGVRPGVGYAEEKDLAVDTETIVGTGLTAGYPVFPSDSGELVEVLNTSALNAGAVLEIGVLNEEFKLVICSVTLSATVPEQIILTDGGGAQVQVTRLIYGRNYGARGAGEIETDVIIRTVAGQDTIGVVLASSQEVHQAVVTIPAGVKATITSLLLTVTKPTGTESSTVFKLYGAQIGKVFRQVFQVGLQRTGSSIADFSNQALDIIEGPVDLFLTAETTAVADVGSRITVLYIE